MYEASLVCLVYDNDYKFDDIMLIGVAHSMDEACSLQMEAIYEVMETFGNNQCTVKTDHSEYENFMTIVDTEDENNSKMHFHYYLLFASERSKDEESVQEKYHLQSGSPDET